MRVQLGSLSTIERTFEVRMNGVPSANYRVVINHSEYGNFGNLVYFNTQTQILEVQPLLSVSQHQNITISGTNFGQNVLQIEVYFDEHEAYILSLSNTELQVTAPSDLE